MKLFWPGVAFIALGVWDISSGRASFFLVGERWNWPTFHRDKSPRLFWFCVAVEFLIALACFGAAILDGILTYLS